MDRQTTIAAIRRESADLKLASHSSVLREFSLTSFSEGSLEEMSLAMLQELLGRIRRLVILGGE